MTAVFPCLVAVVRALTGRWMATSDNAFIAIRALDVLTIDHHPLLGTFSSASTAADTTIHHPGPLLFDVMAVPAHLLGTDVGIPLAIGCLNALCVWWMTSLIGQVGGLTARLVAAVVAALLTWTMTWPLVITPWNSYAAMVPALLFFVSCGALTLDEPAAAMPAVVGASLCLQIHIGYVYIVGFTLLLTLGLRGLHRRSDAAWSGHWSRRQWLAPLAVLALLWLQPLIDLVINRGDSNVAAMLRGAASQVRQIGPSNAIQLVAAVVALPPWWLPGGFDGQTMVSPRPPLWASALILVVLAALLLLVAWRGPTRLVRAFGLYVALLLPVAVVSVALVPLHPAFGFSGHQWRWLWVLAILPTLVGGWVIADVVQRSGRQIAPALPVAAAAAASLTVMAANVIGYERPLPVHQQERDAIRELIAGLPFAELERCRRVLVDYGAGFEPPALVAPSVLLALRERGIDFASTADSMQLDRHPDGDEDCRLTVAREPARGRVVGALDGRLPLVITLVGADARGADE